MKEKYNIDQYSIIEEFDLLGSVVGSIPIIGPILTGTGAISNGNKSNSVSSSTTDISNQNTLNNINKSIFDTGINVMVENLQVCSNSSIQSNACAVTSVNNGGTTTNSGNQSNVSKVNYSCTNNNNVQSSMISKMLTSAASEIKALSDTNLETALKAQASTNSKSGFLATPISSSATSVNNNNTKIRNETIQNIYNTYEQKLRTNFTSKTVAECIGSNIQNNALNISSINNAGTTNNNCNQSNDLNTIQNCKQLSNVISDTTNQVFQEYKILTNANNETKQVVNASAESKSTSVATGPIQDLFNGIANVMGASTGLYSLSFIIISCVVLIICVVMMSNKTSSELPTDKNNL